MDSYPSDIAFSPAVKAIQHQQGSRRSYAKMEQGRGWQTLVTPELRDQLATLDMFYLGTSSATGQPYIQYRGGPPGFLKVIDPQTLGWAEFGGNQQFISTGNVSENPQAFLFLMDYYHRRRFKLWGTMEVIEGNDELNHQLQDASYQANVERAVVFSIKAWDANCPQHIHRRIPLDVAEQQMTVLRSQVEQLQLELAALKKTP